MKKLFPVMAMCMLALAGCLREGTDGCPACMSLVFTHGGTTAGFDNVIGNDVQMQLFYDGVWHSSRTIPYGQIAGGRSYSFKKSHDSQQVQVLFYAVPRGADDSVIPAAYDGLAFTLQGVSMRDATRALPRCLPYEQDLYSGVLSITESPARPSSHTIAMNDVFCRVQVIVENADLFYQRFPGADPSTGLMGTARGAISYNGAPKGGEVEVVSALTHDTANNRLSTPVMRVMPSPDGLVTLAVNVYENPGRQTLPVFDTDELSVAGKDITIVYNWGPASVTITLTVDGWKVRTQTVLLD